jgi:GTP-binding protein
LYRDRIKLTAVGGKGGDGCISFRREKYVPKGGPDGGDGGRGGDVIIRLDHSLDDLSHLRAAKVYRAENGRPGSGAKRHGKDGQHLLLDVPSGTSIYKDEESVLIAEVSTPKDKIVVAKGGKGGKGNIHFATSTDRAPRRRERGAPGQRVKLTLEYVPAVDVCIVGRPNSGKSTLLSALTSARPKIADYPFTTTTPTLGVLRDEKGRSVKMMELPALVKGSAVGREFGHRWMKYARKCTLLLFIVDVREEVEHGVYSLLLEELSSFDRSVLKKPRILALSKIDEGGREKLDADRDRQYPVVRVSFKTGEGVKRLREIILRMLKS